MQATSLIWTAAGCPSPHETDGTPVPKKGTGAPCSACGEPGWYRFEETLSDHFTTVKNASRAWPYGGECVCAACVFACKTLRLRCAGWFATPKGVEWWRTRPVVKEPEEVRGQSAKWWRRHCRHWTGPDARPDPLATLCNPPEPPFVAGLPLTGIQHGGESHIMRAWWPNAATPVKPLLKLQSKHVAIYARVATSRARYPLQVDDHHDILVDVPLWSRLRQACDALLADLMASGVYASDARKALVTIVPPPRTPAAILTTWRARVADLLPHHGSMWWPLFVDLLLLPDRKDPDATRERDRPEAVAPRHQDMPPDACVPDARHQAGHEPGPNRPRQMVLPFT